MGSVLRQSIDTRGVATLTLARADVHNAFNAELIADLTSALEVLGDDQDIRAVVLTGDGVSFCAGGDVHWMRSMATASKEENRADALLLAAMLRTLNYFPKPTLARVNGAAFGGGVGLIACCDTAIAVDGARFGVTEARLGLVPAVIAPYVLRAIGESAARHYFVNAEIFSADTALRLGLVHTIVPANELDNALERQLASLMKTGPNANEYAKRLVFSVAGHDINQQQQIDQATAEMIAELRASEEGREGLAAFLEKRAPRWMAKKQPS